MDREFLDKVNEVYHQLEMKQAQMVFGLSHRILELECGWYNGHYHQDSYGDWCRESYPIPVVEVKGICDIEISFDKVSVSAKLKRSKALAYSYNKIARYPFEAYGVEDYLCDFYKSGMTIDEMKANIAQSDEQEIGFAFSFPMEVDGEKMYEFVKLLRREGFYN